MTVKLEEALRKLDPSNDRHWTEGKEPRMETVRLFAEDQNLTREAVALAAPGLTRDTATGYWLTVELPAQAPLAGVQPLAAGSGGVTATPQAAGAGAGPQGSPGAESNGSDVGSNGDTMPTESEAKPLEMAGPGTGRENEISAVEAELEMTREAITAKRKLIRELTEEVSNLVNLEVNLAERFAALSGTNNSLAQTIQDYLASQTREREKRGARHALVVDSGLDLKQLVADMKSPLDAAMSRKSTRGGQRPALLR